MHPAGWLGARRARDHALRSALAAYISAFAGLSAAACSIAVGERVAVLKTAGGVSAVRSSGASARRTAAAVLGWRLRAARFARNSVRSDAGSMGATPAVEGGSAHDKSADGDV